MISDNDFLILKVNDLERKIYELENRINQIEESTNENKKTPNTYSRKDTTRYEFNGLVYKKSRLVLAVVTQYVLEHPGISLKELQDEFPASEFNLGTYSCVKNINDIPSNQIKPVKRYFIDKSEIITLQDGTKVAVCTQWSIKTIELFINYINKFGYKTRRISM